MNNKKNYLVLLALVAIVVASHTAADKSSAITIGAAVLVPLITLASIAALYSGRLLLLAASWLALPYVLFAIYWLNLAAGIALFGATTAIVWQLGSVRQQACQLTTTDCVALALGLAWFSLAGIGGVGYQSIDWIMHNGRLVDLVNYDWPVIYTEGAIINSSKWPEAQGALTGYLAFQLPAAWLGKLFDSLELARLAQYVWAWWGFAVLLLASKLLGSAQRPLLLILGLALFAGTDLAIYFHHLLLQVIKTPEMLLQDSAGSDQIYWMMAFWSVEYFNYFFGVFLPPATQFHLAPNQVIAVWLVAIALLRCHLLGDVRRACAWLALLCFWSPFGAVGLALFWSLLSLQARSVWPQLKAWPIYLPSVVLLLIFALFYRVMDESVSGGVFQFAWQATGVENFWWKFVVFHAISWGVYAFMVILTWPLLNTLWRQVFMAIFVALVLVSVLDYGLFSDLKMRATAGLYLLLLLGLFELVRSVWHSQRRGWVYLFLPVVLIVVLSNISYFIRDVQLYQHTHADVSVVSYAWGYEFLRSVNDLYMCYLSADTRYCD